VFSTLFEVLNPGGTVLLSTSGAAGATYETITWKRPGRPKRRIVEQGPYVAGEVEIVSVLDVDRLRWEVRIVAASYAALQNAYDTLVDAVEAGPDAQFRVTIAGVVRTWRLTGSPNISERTEGRDGDAMRWGFREELVVDWPCNPTAY
jgi:hypothetical protein